MVRIVGGKIVPDGDVEDGDQNLGSSGTPSGGSSVWDSHTTLFGREVKYWQIGVFAILAYILFGFGGLIMVGIVFLLSYAFGRQEGQQQQTPSSSSSGSSNVRSIGDFPKSAPR